MSAPKLLTLTIKRARLDRARVSFLRRAFRRLRQQDAWRAHGGIYCIESGKIRADGSANLHIHAIIDAPYISQRVLSGMWRKATDGEGYIVDIRAYRKPSRGVKYLTKYLTKGVGNLPLWQRNLINDAFHGVRLFQPFGTMVRVNAPIAVCPSCGATGAVYCPTASEIEARGLPLLTL